MSSIQGKVIGTTLVIEFSSYTYMVQVLLHGS